MTAQFFAALRGRLAELVQDLRYLHKPSGEQVAPQIIDIMLPRLTVPAPEADEYPFVRWLIVKGEFARLKPGPFLVLLDAGIYTAGSVMDGVADITELCLALGRIVEKSNFAPYRLVSRVRFTIGSPGPDDADPGLQAHPYYHCRLFLDFQGGGIIDQQ